MFSNQSSRVYCDAYDLEGGVSVLQRKIAAAGDERARWAFIGARATLECIMFHRLNTQADFFVVFDSILTSELEKGR